MAFRGPGAGGSTPHLGLLVAGTRRSDARGMVITESASAQEFEARHARGALLYEQSDIPEGMTIAQWRRSRAPAVTISARRRPLTRRLRTALRPAL